MGAGSGGRPSWDDVGARLAELRRAAGLTQAELARRIPFNRPTLVEVEGGRRASAALVNGADRVLRTGGELAALRRTVLEATSGEVSQSDRRTFVAAFPTAALAAQWSDRIARADPTPRELRALQVGVQRIAGSYYSTPLPVLLPQAEDGWMAVHEILERPVSDQARRELRKVAGRYTFYLAHIAVDAGDNEVAQDYLSLAGQHAVASGDTLVAGSVAVLDSTMAYFDGDNQTAADIAARTFDTTDVHPYVVGMLAACRARAAALCAGRQGEARAALDMMQGSVWGGEILPGCRYNDLPHVETQTAVVLGHLGEGERAEDYARSALRTAVSEGRDREAGGISNALARALLRRDDPEPEQAATVVIDAIGTVDGQPTGWVTGPAGKLYGELTRRWPDLADVRQLGEVVAESRKARPPAQPA